MIDLISNWTGELVVSLIIVTIIEMILPENKTKKYVKTVMGVYIIFCIISPFINAQEVSAILKNTQKQMEKIQIDNQVAINQEENNVEALYIQEFEKDIKKKVEELGYKVKQCSVDIDITATKQSAGVKGIYLKIEDKNIKNPNIEIEDVEKVEISINEKEVVNNKSDTEKGNKVKEFLSDYYEISKDKIEVIYN